MWQIAIRGSVWAAGLAVLCFAPAALAQRSIPIQVAANIPEGVQLVVNGLGGPFTTELSTTPSNDVVVASLLVSSNGPNGFQVSFSSLNSGKLVRQGGSPDRESDFTTYRLDLENEPGGVLGTGVPPARERRNLNLTLGTETVRFDDNVLGSTVDKAMVLEIHTQPKPELFAGTYSDVITVTVEDL